MSGVIIVIVIINSRLFVYLVTLLYRVLHSPVYGRVGTVR